MNALVVIDREMANLTTKHKRQFEAAREKRRELRKIIIELETLRRELEALGRLRAQLIPSTVATGIPTEAAKNRTDPSANGVNRNGRNLPKPSAAVLDYVRQHPNAKISDVATMLSDRIHTKSKAPRRLLFSIIDQLVEKGKMVRVGTDKKELVVPEKDGKTI